jgi:predicted  nucleic acid-binding Zn ribbon protein
MKHRIAALYYSFMVPGNSYAIEKYKCAPNYCKMLNVDMRRKVQYLRGK